jgi:2-dehydro-3-deoxygalactonokinase
LLALDWGTSSLRAALMTADGHTMAEASSSDGLLAVPDRQFEQTLQALCGPWLKQFPGMPILAAGMIGSRQGWYEAPYVQCPAGFDEMASGLVWPEPGRLLGFVPGLLTSDADGNPDVLRGEEVQIFGTLDSLGMDHGVFVLPGTHSKWAIVENRRVMGFHTFMTGELYALLRRQSILSRLMPEQEDSAHEWLAHRVSFLAGCRAASDGALLHRLFSIRARGLFNQLPPSDQPAFLSGLLIGEEIREALALLGTAARTTPLCLVGNDTLLAHYAVALQDVGIEAMTGPAHASFHGLFAIAQRRGLVG